MHKYTEILLWSLYFASDGYTSKLPVTYQCQETPLFHSDRDSHTHCHTSDQKRTDSISHASAHSCASQAIATNGHRSHEGILFALPPGKQHRETEIIPSTRIHFRPLLCFYIHKLNPVFVVREGKSSSYLRAYSSLISHLQPSVQGPLNGHTLAGVGTVGRDSCDEGVELIFLLLQLLHQALDGAFCKRLTLAPLSVAHQAVDDA